MDSKKEVNVNDVICGNFQNQVSQVLIRHKSVLDIMTKLDEYNARINRAVAKSVTLCGCISIDAKKQNFGEESFENMFEKAESHIHGNLCNSCRDILEEEIGSYLFYLASLCNTLDIDLEESINKEYDRIKTLGIYSLK
jgi:uncharacterized protein YabN with tetrapyrrole methylase and pyrophosphatase domain